VSWPTPHGMAFPSGWVELAGGVVDPSSAAMVNRVVQVGGAPVAVYW
jgi:hypothetical protein